MAWGERPMHNISTAMFLTHRLTYILRLSDPDHRCPFTVSFHPLGYISKENVFISLCRSGDSLSYMAVLSDSSPGWFSIAKNSKFLHADNENTKQTTRQRSWQGFVWGTCKKVPFLTLRLVCCCFCMSKVYRIYKYFSNMHVWFRSDSGHLI